MRKLEFKEQLVTVAERIDFNADEKVVGITIKNQGTNTITSSFGSTGKMNEILPQASEAYGGLEGYYLTGYVEIDFSGAGTNECIVKIAYDRGEICEA